MVETTARPIAALRAAFEAGLDWLYPRHCYHCGRSLAHVRSQMLCRRCLAELEDLRVSGALCATCGLPLAGEPAPELVCMACRVERRHFERARAFVAYAGPAASLIRAYKFDGDYMLGPRALRAMMDRGWTPPDVEPAHLVVPVPLHRRRRRERGYDQALLLAEVVAERIGGELRPRVLARTRYTSQQALLPMGRRWDNVRAAFAARRPDQVEGRSVLLVDDVLTTGVTADECARELKAAGAARVHVLTLARTAP